MFMFIVFYYFRVFSYVSVTHFKYPKSGAAEPDRRQICAIIWPESVGRNRGGAAARVVANHRGFERDGGAQNGERLEEVLQQHEVVGEKETGFNSSTAEPHSLRRRCAVVRHRA